MKKKLCCIFILIILLLNSSTMLLISEAVDAIQNEIESNSEDKIKVLSEINLTKYENFNTTQEDSEEGSKGVLVQFNLKTGIEFLEGEEYKPIKKTSTNIELPWIGDYKPSRVEVITKSTQSTNGEKNASYEYHSSTGILQIVAENTDYAENIADARDEYEIICIYRKECYTNNEERELKIRANVEEILNDEEKTRIVSTPEQKYTVTDNISSVISIEHETDNVYDGYITANILNPENQYETPYNENLKIIVSNKEIASKIEIKESSDVSLYSASTIDKNQVLNMLGDNGSIEILDEEENVLNTINKDSETDDNGKIKVNYTNKAQKFYIRLNNIAKEGIIEVYNSRVIIPNVSIIDNMITTYVGINGLTKENKVVYEQNNQNDTQIKPAISNIETKINTETLVNNTSNQVIVTAVLKNNSSQYSLFKNPIINIEMPKEITYVRIGSTDIIYDNQAFQVKASGVTTNEKGNKVVNLQIEGTQKSYENSSVIDGTTIKIPLTLNLTKNMDSKVEKINIAYSNEITGTTENKNMEITLLNKVVNTTIDNNKINTENIQDENTNKQDKVITTYENDGVKTEIIEEVGNVQISNDGTIYERQIIKQNIKVTNNSNAIKKVKVTINVPDEMVYVKKVDDDGNIYIENQNYYKFSEKYKYEEQQEKQVTIELEVKPGEVKKDFIELKVKDLSDNEEERTTNIKCNIQINNSTPIQLNIQNVIKQAEIEVDTKLLVGGNRREWKYTITINNLTNRELKDVNIFVQTFDKFDLKYADLNGGEVLKNLSGNTWAYTIDSLKHNEQDTEDAYYILTGEVSDEIYNDDNTTYEMTGVTTIYGNDINTYVSNEARMNGYIEAVEVEMQANKTQIKADEEIIYTVNIKNVGKTWGMFDTYTYMNVQDVIPREFQPISITYNDFTINKDRIKDNNDLEFESQTYTETQVTKDISTLDIPEGYDEEDAPNIDLLLTIPEGKTVTMTIKAKARMIFKNVDTNNIVKVEGKWIKTKETSSQVKVLKYDYDDQKDKPTNPDNPNNPNNPNIPNDFDNSNEKQKFSISGVAWIDENEDGKRTIEEKKYSNMSVMLYNYSNNIFVNKVQTNSDGEYKFTDLAKGKYIIIFLYDTEEYTITSYQKSGVIESKNSDAISKKIRIDGEEVTAGLTNTLVVESDLENIDIGLIENKDFDLKLEKYVNKITIQTKDGKTKTYDYNNKQFAKVEIHSKKINGATAVIEYKIVITNTGETEGKAVQIIDKLPDGLSFSSELNSDWYEKDGKLYTNSLSGENIDVGESKEVTLVLIKNMNSTNVGMIENTALIGISSNDKAIEDKNDNNNTSKAQIIIGVATGIAQKIGITIVIIIGLIMSAILIIKNKKILKTTLFILIFAICLVGNINQVNALSIKGVDIGDGNGNAKGDDNLDYHCGDHGKRFCSQYWHPATFLRDETTTTPSSNWESLEAGVGQLNLYDNSVKSNIIISKVDSEYNKIGPFNVSSTINTDQYSVKVSYMDVDGNLKEEEFETIDFSWKNDFYIKIPNTIKQVIKVSISATYKTKVYRTVTTKTRRFYSTSVPSGDSFCAKNKNGLQSMYHEYNTSSTESREVTRQGTIDINGPWTGTGDLEIKKSDNSNEEKVLKNTEFKLLKGTNQDESLVIYKDNQKVEKIIVEKEIEFNKAAWTDTEGKTTNATIDGETGYTIKFDSTLENATILITNKEGKVLIKNLLLGEYTFVENNNLNYGYTKMVTEKINEFEALDQTTTWNIKNEKQTGEIKISKIDDRNRNKKLSGVEFVLIASNKEGYIKVKVDDKWRERVIGTVTIDDTDDIVNNATLDYTTDINEATRFVTDDNGEINIKNLLLSTNGEDAIKYKLEEVANPNYGYLVDSGKYKNYRISYNGETITSDGWITVDKDNVKSNVIKNHQEYIRIEGYVWEEIANSKDNRINNLRDENDALIEGINVLLYKDGKLITTKKTDSNGWYCFGTTKQNGESYTTNDYLEASNGNLLIDELDRYYVEFEYDGLRFTSVEAITDYLNKDYENTSKATETARGRLDRKDRSSVNSDFSEITNNKARNNGKETYELRYDYDSNTHMSTYKDWWGYQYNNEKNKTRLKVTPANYYQIIASTKVSGFNLKDAWNARCASTGEDTLTGINLGIKRRAQADLAIMSDIQEVNIDVDNYENTYTYEKRSEYENQNPNDSKYDSAKDGFGIDVKFGGKTQSIYSSKGLNLYTRRIYEADLALADNKSNDILKIYVTYKIVLKNQSSALDAKVNEVANYYDSNYTIVDSWITQGNNKKTIGAQSWSSISKYGERNSSNGYNVAYTQQTSNITLKPNEKAEVYIKFKLNNDAVKQLIEKQTTLNNITEISSFSTLNQGSAYAAIDMDSNPGSVKGITLAENRKTETTLNGRKYNIETKTVDTKYYEDDTDVSPALIIGIEESKDRGLSGTVFEDENANSTNDETHMGEERIGDGILYTGGTYMGNGRYAKVDKNRVKDATVELLEYNENTSDHISRDKNGNAKVAKLYQLKVENGKATGTEVEARINTNAKGDYQFLGVVPGRYLIRYTYGEGSWIVDSNGNNIEEINIRDYKSTIITSSLMKQALNLEKKIDSSKDERMGDLNWILKYSDKNGRTKSKSQDERELIRYSDATDDISKRYSTDDIYFGSYLQNSKITADTAFFDVGVEYREVTDNGFNKKVTFTDYKDEYNLSGDKIVVLVEESSGKYKIKLKDTFYSVNPYQDFGITERARQDYEVNKRISNLKVVLANGQVLISGNPYVQTVEWDNLEKENTGDNKLLYTKVLPGEVNIEIDNEVLQGAQINIEYTISVRNKSEKDYKYTENKDYYYYGTNGKNEVAGAIKKVVDYMEDDLIYNDYANSLQGWQKISAEDLLDWKDNKESTEPGKQLIAKAGDQINGVSYNVYDGIKDGKYTIGITEAFNKNEIKVGEINSVKLYGSKLLSTKENGFSVTNHAEIIETTGIRTAKGSIPGNYNPSKEGGRPDEPDDDKTTIVITPPTGLTDNKIFIISTITVSLIILVGGIYLIKKKVLE